MFEHDLPETSNKEKSQGCPHIEGKERAQASQEREAQLADELAVLGAELARVRQVAGRATAREIANGSKDEGIVPMTMHLEEVCCHPDLFHMRLVPAVRAQAPSPCPDITEKALRLCNAPGGCPFLALVSASHAIALAALDSCGAHLGSS